MTDAPVHIPGLITAAGTTQPPLPATAQPGGTLPPGTMTAGSLPTPQVAQPAATIPALPQAGAQPVAQGSVLPPPPQIDPAQLQQFLAAQQAAQQQPAQPAAQPQQPAAQPPQTMTFTLPTMVPGYNQPAAAQPTIPGLMPPATQPATQPAGQPPAAQPSATPPAAGEPDGISDGNGKDYPEGKPLAEMTPEEQAKYYKWYSRQWETRAKSRGDYDALKAKADQFDQLSASTATEVEQRIAAARNEGYAQAAQAAAIVLVDAHVRAGLQGRVQPHQVEALAANLNHTHFLSADGRSVDAAKVATFVDNVAPVSASPANTAVPAATAPAAPAAPGALPTGVPTPAQPGQPATGLPRPDLGQGAQTQAPIDKLALGRQQAQNFLAGNL